MSIGKRLFFWFWLFPLLTNFVCGQALTPHKVLGRYQQFVWQDQHGLPQNGVNAITRTRDGYLWVGTFEGAARFDGVQFTVFDNSNTPALQANHQILALLEDRTGNLWLGTNGGGLVRYRDGQFQAYDTAAGLSSNYVHALLEDRAGGLWIATDNGMSRWREGRFTTYHGADGLPDDYIWSLAQDTAGSLWVGTNKGVARWDSHRFIPAATPPGAARALLVDRAGTVWIGSSGLYQLRTGQAMTPVTALTGVEIQALCEDRAGNLWIGTRGKGVALLAGNHCTFHTPSSGIPSETIKTIYEDPEGDIWIGTADGGLCQLRLGRFQVYTKEDGLPHDWATAIFEDSTGRIWMGTTGGLGLFQNGIITGFTTKDGLPRNGGGSLTEDRQGNIWINASGQLCQYRDGRFTPWPLQNGRASVVLADRAGNLWIGMRSGGLQRYRDGQSTVYTTREGLVDDKIFALYEDRKGGIWIGTLGGLSYWHNGQLRSWTVKDGLSSNQPLSFYEDHHGSVWIGTSGGGLSRWRDGKFVNLTVRDGLYDNLAFQILADTADDSGSLWMSCNRGIYRVRWQELNEFAEGRRRTVTSYVYGVSDGMLSRECNGASPAGWKTRDGRLWFPTVRGVVVIDPRRLVLPPPRVAIETAEVDRQRVATGQTIQLSPQQENLEIRYTALSWGRPQQVRFRYQMVGLDHEWIDSGLRRTAYYSHLPPGTYEFRVIADNGEGVWDNEGQRLRVIVLPPFYRTWWFRMLIVLFVGGALIGIFQFRVRQLERRQAAQQMFARQLIESQEAERKRLAAELHNSLGQHLLVIMNRALRGEQLTDEQTPARGQFNEITESATQAISEVRAISHNLRPVNLERLGLAVVIEELVERVAKSAGLQFSTDIEDLEGLLTHDAQMNLFRILQECINNIVQHAQATKAYLEIFRTGDELQVTVRDNGRGYDVTTTPHGLGLTSMSERIRLLGGTKTVTTVLGAGTTVELKIPLTPAIENRQNAESG